jgi:hypothetical protein
MNINATPLLSHLFCSLHTPPPKNKSKRLRLIQSKTVNQLQKYDVLSAAYNMHHPPPKTKNAYKKAISFVSQKLFYFTEFNKYQSLKYQNSLIKL